ncbi:DUF1707 and DUF4190 domain-containing protein [Streptomyces brasiliensis]|uniref:DUF4190 domain-containing protein n=1 Tax=Streptomyces brasiliensis TaxID=1954 RepID=A0A917KQ58_9ACTN|nr:DUF1707 and DUF4190 domain-containing protein [Streptomyces brasiliensis]GGJ19229.1 hypothetical protein GCM10010121_032710 [Streptomyces brasiliensis]
MSQPTPWQQQPWQPWQGQSGSSMLASHADRERAVDVLRAGFGEGRLLRDEFDKRVARAHQARTVGELALLVADLPQGPVPVALVLPAAPTAVPAAFMPAPRPPANGKAVGAMVCGVLTVMTAGITGIPAVVLGHSARAEIRRTGEGGDALALTGLILGWLSIAGWALFFTIIIVAAAASPG